MENLKVLESLKVLENLKVLRKSKSFRKFKSFRKSKSFKKVEKFYKKKNKGFFITLSNPCDDRHKKYKNRTYIIYIIHISLKFLSGLRGI